MPEMSVSDLIENIPILEMRGDPRTVVKGIAYDSRDVKPGFLFAAMGGVHTDGHGYVEDALGRGATAILHARPLPVDAGAAVCIRVENPRIALSPIAAAFYKWPSRSIRTIGVTGTDGKSSTVWFITQLLGFLGRKAGFLSTVSFQTAEEIVKNPFRQSTPEASEIQGMLREMVRQGKEFAVVEATSHGLSRRMNRLGDVQFDAAVMTNVTHEHLEFHGSFEQYRSDKANLFRSLSPDAPKDVGCPRFAVVNGDDPSAAYFTEASRVPVFSYGLSGKADLVARDLRMDITGTSFVMAEARGAVETRMSIPGIFWVENALAACLAVAHAAEVPPLSLAAYLPRLRGVLGRMDYVDQRQPFAVIVDYAHTPGAFLKLFPWVRANTRGRVIVVFGSAGERDNAKRPMQGKAAADHCDVVIVTDEDPRGEDRMQIIEQVAAGCAGKKRGEDLFLIPDRREAIRFALSLAEPGDTVLLLGKGHEGSIIGPGGSMQWDERAEAVAALHERGFGA